MKRYSLKLSNKELNLIVAALEHDLFYYENKLEKELDTIKPIIEKRIEELKILLNSL